jgi:AraC-like DNA-binding protein
MKEFFYELKHDIGANYFTVEEAENLAFPMHMHRCYEIILLREGTMRVRIEKDAYEIEAGDMILVKPNRVHSLESPITDCRCRHKLCIFSPELIAAVSPQLLRYQLTSPVIRNVPAVYRTLFEEIRETAALGGIKGFLYCICDLFCRQLDLSREDLNTGKGDLIRDVLRYVERNIHASCSLARVAEALGYSASYLSRVFNEVVGMPYTTYVRHVKINQACYLLKNTNDSITDIVSRCGYASVATFNHNFKELTKCNPTEYRKKSRH